MSGITNWTVSEFLADAVTSPRRSTVLTLALNRRLFRWNLYTGDSWVADEDGNRVEPLPISPDGDTSAERELALATLDWLTARNGNRLA
jgi:hypothetical protein